MSEHEEITVIKRTITCRFCGSTDLSKFGTYGDTQNYVCKVCNRKSAGKDCYPGMKYPRDLNIKALTYYYNGMSFKGVNHTINDLYQQDLPKKTLWKWVLKFSKMVNQCVLDLHPDLGGVWVADETVIDLWGQHYWFWDIIDERTRFLIASHLSKTRTEGDATKLFYMAKLRSNTRPKVIRTDKLAAYYRAFNKVFYSTYKARHADHLTSEGFDSPTNINLIERFHGTIKQRTKIMRDLKSRASARIILDGFVTHYNFFMEHDYLGGKTPATAGGVGGGIQNWGDLIERSLHTPRRNPTANLEWEGDFAVE